METQTNTLVLVGPNGNLTTLFGGIASLHPEVLGFDHGFEVVHNHWLMPEDVPLYRKDRPSFNDADILLSYTPEKYENFIRIIPQVVDMTGKDVVRLKTGKDNRYNILSSHTFNRPEMRALREKLVPRKKDFKCIFWKEGEIATSYIIHSNKFLHGIREENRIRFFYPIRNPVHTYYSCRYKGFFDFMRGLYGDPIKYILYTFAFFFQYSFDPDLRNRILFIFEKDIKTKEAMMELERVMGVSHDEVWMNSIIENINVKAIRDYSKEPDLDYIKQRMEKMIKSIFFDMKNKYGEENGKVNLFEQRYLEMIENA